MKPALIGICGPARSGKDSLARAFVKVTGWGFDDPAKPSEVEIVSWSDPLKRLAMDMFDLTWEQVNGIEFDREAPYFPGGQSVRQMLQELGTDVGRAYDPDLWVRKLVELPADPAVKWRIVPGTRFPNELEACDFSVWMDRPDLPIVRAHSSEASITREMCTVTVHNRASLRLLDVAARDLLEHFQQAIDTRNRNNRGS